jgi:hypothetical protein
MSLDSDNKNNHLLPWLLKYKGIQNGLKCYGKQNYFPPFLRAMPRESNFSSKT